MKRIAYLLADFPVLSETFVGNEIRAMEDHGHPVFPIIMNRRDGAAQPEDKLLADRSALLADLPSGVTTFGWLAPHSLLRAFPFLRAQSLLGKASLLYQGARIAAFLARENIDHIHAHFAGGAAAHAIIAARLAGITCSFVCHGHDVYSEPQDLEAKLRHADLVVSVCRDLTLDLLAFEPAAHVVDVPCGTNPHRFQRREGESNGRLLFIGRLVEQKGLEDALEALASLPEGKRPALDIVGDGPLRPVLETQTRELGLDGGVRFLGAQPASWFAANGPAYRGLIAPFKCAADGSRDTGPLVIKEAMAMGLPVISTAFMGVKETVTPETGWLVPPADPIALRGAVLALLAQSKTDRAGMAAAARARVEALFTLAGSARRLSDAMEALP